VVKVDAEVGTTCKVDAGLTAGFMAAMFGIDPAPAMFMNEPGPQRHLQSHWPFACVTPVPEAMAPGEPTGGIEAATKSMSADVHDL
jgi:hypothetical protein